MQLLMTLAVFATFFSTLRDLAYWPPGAAWTGGEGVQAQSPSISAVSLNPNPGPGRCPGKADKGSLNLLSEGRAPPQLTGSGGNS